MVRYPNRQMHSFYLDPVLSAGLKEIKERDGVRSVAGRRSGYTIRFYPTVILQHPRPGGVQQFGMWRDFLHTALHELGHIETRRRYVFESDREKADPHFRRYIESLADAWAAAPTATPPRSTTVSCGCISRLTSL